MSTPPTTPSPDSLERAMTALACAAMDSKSQPQKDALYEVAAWLQDQARRALNRAALAAQRRSMKEAAPLVCGGDNPERDALHDRENTEATRGLGRRLIRHTPTPQPPPHVGRFAEPVKPLPGSAYVPMPSRSEPSTLGTD